MNRYVPTDAEVKINGVDISDLLTTVSTTVEFDGGWRIFLEGPYSEALDGVLHVGNAEAYVIVAAAGRRFEGGGVIVRRRVDGHNTYTGDPWLWGELIGPPPTQGAL